MTINMKLRSAHGHLSFLHPLNEGLGLKDSKLRLGLHPRISEVGPSPV